MWARVGFNLTTTTSTHRRPSFPQATNQMKSSQHHTRKSYFFPCGRPMQEKYSIRSFNASESQLINRDYRLTKKRERGGEKPRLGSMAHILKCP